MEQNMITLAPTAFNVDVADEQALRSLAEVATSAGVSPTLVQLLCDSAQPTVARVRAYSIVGRKLTFAS
jgi:hypothetical protein